MKEKTNQRRKQCKYNEKQDSMKRGQPLNDYVYKGKRANTKITARRRKQKNENTRMIKV